MNTENNTVVTAPQQEPSHQEPVQNNQTFPLPPQYQPKPLFELSKGDNAFGICAIIAGIFTSLFGIFGGFALGYLLSLVFMLTLFTVYFIKLGKADIFPIVCGLLSLATGAIFLCTTNISVRFWGMIVGFLLALMCFDGLTKGKAKGNRQSLGVFYSAASTAGNIGAAIKSLFSNSKGEKRAFGKVLMGLLCAIPVLAVVLPLLLSSDDAFRGMMSNLFDNTFTTLLKIVFGVGMGLFVITYGFSLKAGRVTKLKPGKFSGIENVYVISFLSAIAVCYLLYLFSQLAYFFSAFQGFLPDGEITYAQYARKGFFEMCIIAVINLAIVFSALLFAKKKGGKVCHGIKAIATFIAAFTLMIIATAISKMVLYIGEYGMTVLRLTTSAFMVFLAVVFISVILRIYTTKINMIKTALLAAGCIVVILGTVNVNAVCAKYNYESYKSGTLESIDLQALYDLGDEGIPYLVTLASGKDIVAPQAQTYLATAYLYDYFDDMENTEFFTVDDLKENQKNKGFQYFSIPKAAAYDRLYEFIENNAWFPSVCQTYANEVERDYYDSYDYFFPDF